MKLFTILLSIIICFKFPNIVVAETKSPTLWEVQSVDTMKYSRDLARAKKNDPQFINTIRQQINDIALLNVTHIAVATPYDAEFIPFLSLWIKEIRKKNLHVWFRGNFSGWESWYGYERITRANHLQKTTSFITNNAGLFENGDIFTPCHECENGGPGDPRSTGDIAGHRQFLIDSYKTTTEAFAGIGKSVRVGYFSMNYDIAQLIMDEKTTASLGGIVTIDHYVKTPQQLDRDITQLAELSHGKIYLGEFGAPIPDINGSFSMGQQQQWIDEALLLLAKNPHVYGINYWVNVGGSTAIWNENGSPRTGVETLRKYFAPTILNGAIIDQFNKPIKYLKVQSSTRSTTTNSLGQFILPMLDEEKEIYIETDKKTTNTLQTKDIPESNIIVIQKTKLNLLERILDYLYNLFK